MPDFTEYKVKDPKIKTQEHSCNHIVTVLLQNHFYRGVLKQVIGEKQWSRF
jgi:hypothetical protein